MVKFLTPAFGEEGIKPLPALGVNAQALNYQMAAESRGQLLKQAPYQICCKFFRSPAMDWEAIGAVIPGYRDFRDLRRKGV